MITYQVENFRDCIAEAMPLLFQHWEEIALDKDTVLYSPDWDIYDKLVDQNLVEVITVRDEGKLIGYSAYFVHHNLHYKHLIVAETDIFWVHPDYRKGRTGIKLFQEAEKHLKSIGVHKITSKVKKHFDVGKVFTHLGYQPIETVYCKTIG